MQRWAQMVPVMKGRAFFSVMSAEAEAYSALAAQLDILGDVLAGWGSRPRRVR
jgi:hypothetical protein